MRRVDRGEIAPFAFAVGPAGNEVSLFHPNQLAELKATCFNRVHRRSYVADALAADKTATE